MEVAVPKCLRYPLVLGLAKLMNVWSSEKMTLPWESHARPLKAEMSEEQ